MQIINNEVHIYDELIIRFLDTLGFEKKRVEGLAIVYEMTDELIFSTNQCKYLFQSITEQIRINQRRKAQYITTRL